MSGGRGSDLIELLQRDVNNLRNENEQLKGTLKLSQQPHLLSSDGGLNQGAATDRSHNQGERLKTFDKLPFSPIDSTSVKLNTSVVDPKAE